MRDVCLQSCCTSSSIAAPSHPFENGGNTEKTTNDAGKKRATFAEMVGKEKAEEQKEIQYKNCVVGFALGLTIETTPKGVLTKISLKVSHFCQHISTNMHPFMQSGET
jgi:hypothetical protein